MRRMVMRMKKFRHPGRIGKKAQEESQLNWIFILIAGAVILAFFVFIVIKQRGASEAKFSGKIAQQLNTILVGAKVSSGTVQEIPTPEVSIRFTCNDYYIGPASQRLGNRLVFAPEFVEGDRIITWTLDWNVPFKITSFLYMTSPLVRYVVVGSDDKAKEIFDEMPKKLNKVRIDDLGQAKDEGDKYVRFIFVNPESASFGIPAGFEKAVVSGLIIRSDPSQSTVQFLEKTTTGLTTSGPAVTFTESEVMYGAIFSTKADDYQCLMKRAYTRLNLVASVYAAKFNEIAPIYDGTNCEGYYKDNKDIKALIDATADPSHVDYGSIGEEKSKLKEVNTRLQIYSCPLLY
jgi:hypothetical protein